MLWGAALQPQRFFRLSPIYDIRLHLTRIPHHGKKFFDMSLLLFQVCDSQVVRLPVQMKVRFSSVMLFFFQLTYTSQATL